MAKVSMTGWEQYDIALTHLRTVCLWGPPGIAKTTVSLQRLDQHLQVHKCQGRTWSVTVTEDAVVQELLGHWKPAAKKWEWNNGPVALALKDGALLLNELARASQAVKDAMLSVMDGQRVARIALPNGTEIIPHSNFKLVATSNDDPDELDPALFDRFEAIIHVTEPHPDTVAAINAGLSGLGSVVKSSYKNPDKGLSIRQSFTLIQLLAGGVEREVAGLIAFGPRWTEVDTALKLSV